ncbi:flagellar assembly protein FliH [Polaromonas sp. UC242_47]|uniref:flagellar assembly protein FliH n=1 Tax=Polaromonas sp. UC242_47 TaxID=3374626 RepID=UPI0037AA8D9B
MYNKPVPARSPEASRFVPSAPAKRRTSGAKESLTAWQRWEMASFAEEPLAGFNEAKDMPPEPEVAPFVPALLIDEAELARLRSEAQAAGEALGYPIGYERGQAAGHAAGLAAVREQAANLHALAVALPPALRSAERALAEDLLALALDIARQIVGQSLAADSQAILPVVRDLLHAEPALSGAPQLLLHPDDAALVKEQLKEELQSAGWRVRVDSQLLRGGCRVLAASGEQDATLETRWERVTAALAQTATTTSGPHD